MMLNIFEILKINAEKYPDKVIWEDENHEYTFTDMEIISGKVYRYLKEHKIDKEDIVAISLPRSAIIPQLMLGVWKTGAAFVSLGEHSPQNLIDLQINQTKPKMIFDTEHLKCALECKYMEGYEKSNEHNLACVVYSSGSSGIFKGSMHEYGAIQKAINRTHSFCSFYGYSVIKPNEYRNIFSKGFYSMTAVFSLIDSLVLCYYQYVLPYEKIGNIKEISNLLLEKKINSYEATTRDYEEIKNLNSPYMKELSVSMDMISCVKTPDKLFFNYYGMTESICVLSCFKVDKSYDITPIGKPFHDIDMKIVDEDNNIVSDGQIGEICFVPEYWRGYIAQTDKTKSVYDGTWFHTGDMGYINEDGNYVAIGRKIDIAHTENGYIVPVFIEIAFKKAFPNIQKCHVQIFKDDKKLQISLFYCGKFQYSTEQIVDKLKTSLPSYCLPTDCKYVNDFVYYPSGKINRNSFKNENTVTSRD